MNINTTNNMSAILNSYMKNNKNTANSVSFAGKLQETKQVQKKDDFQVKEKIESAVAEYKRKHPDDTYNVDRQVNAGKVVLSKNGADKVSRDHGNQFLPAVGNLKFFAKLFLKKLTGSGSARLIF